MNQEEVRKRKDWVKNAAIVFLTIMLVLTFFSNTIMNYSLPEVATQYVESGTITAKVRGTGNVEAADPYNIVAKESRVISSVAVKQGDEVEKDQVIYYLEDAESEELTQAQKDLEELKLTYMKGLFGNNVSSDIISKVASGRTDGFSTLQTKVADMQNRMDAAQARVKECQEALEKLTLQSTINTNDATINTIPEENEKAQATTELSDAQTAEAKAEAEFNRDKSERVAELTSRIEEKQKQIDDLKTLISGAESIANSNSTSSGGGDKDTVSSNSIQAMRERERTAKDELDKKLTALNGIFGTNFTADEAYSWSNSVDWDSLGDEQQKEKRQIALQDFRMAYADYKIASDLLNNAVGTLTGYSSNQEQLNNLNQELQELQARLNRVNAITYSPGDSVKDAQAKLNQADKNLSDKTNANKQASVAYQNQIANAEAALKNAQAVYDLLKEEQDEMNADINAELDLAKVSKDIAQKKLQS
ncbi:biotin/lipoyl-binding protein [Parablautia intestinalis]|uniref:biotin/lipoyl-binding protein n=1 Tax=Parablautia intestinalis TaxID=2320100 RepID=UPI00256F293E|nr:biotin/lipoyl-binding protein [Parablautia intestinalis]